MKTTLMAAIITSISEVMETMFFLPVERGDQISFKQWAKDTAPLICRISFHGDVRGTLLLAAPEPLAAQMAANFMGKRRQDLTPEHLSGTLTEMLNMVCGNALGRVASATPCSLDIPELLFSDELPAATRFTLVHTPESALAVSLIMEPGPPH